MTIIGPCEDRPDLQAKVKAAIEAQKSFSPVDRALFESDQRQSFVRGQLDYVVEFTDAASILASEVRRLRAALEADAPAILAAKIEGLKIASEIARAMKTLKVWFGMAIADEIDARIASLEAEMKEGGKSLSQAAEET